MTCSLTRAQLFTTLAASEGVSFQMMRDNAAFHAWAIAELRVVTTTALTSGEGAGVGVAGPALGGGAADGVALEMAPLRTLTVAQRLEFCQVSPVAH